MSRFIRIVNKKEQENDYVVEEVAGLPDGYFSGLHIIDVLELNEDANIIELLASKVKKDGTIVLSGIDALKVCKSVADGSVSLKDANEVFFSNVKNLNSLVDLKSRFVAEKEKWSIQFLGYTDERYLIEVIKLYE